MRLALLLALALSIGCVNPNRNNPAYPYDACDFLRHMELETLGVAMPKKCERGKGDE